MKVLIVDDEPLARGILVRQFQALGYTDLHSYGSVADAMSFVLTEVGEIDLVLTDLQMPEVDGVEFMRLLVELSYSGGVVLISGEDPRLINSVGKLVGAQDLNIMGAFQKPIPTTLVKKVIEGASRKKVSKQKPKGLAITDPHDLKRGILANEMVVHFQPQVSLASGKIVGVESLVRWDHPLSGILMPDQFISLAEDYSMIDLLTQSVLNSSLAAVRRWKDCGYSIPVSVNVSMNNLY